ncbi:response regulator [Chryseobacterium sp. Leaf394]|uniref:LytR/AlgR family response regulator transcription factor n=1 Tax=Chryseobacterium sp. Leaf394 TaxID=1736361 RepID=UPI0006F31412|nr:response regulator [Chryseobacterium sp. Leaf394]KQS91920.1 hypothetical protein ASG21_05530 [Chryseobacterium sp. Leaf394]
MNHTYRIALLEDNSRQLEKLTSYLSSFPNVEIIVKSQNSDHFLDEVEKTHPEILVTDLVLLHSSMNGLDVAQELRIPVVFIGETKDYIKDIENLKRDAEICVDHITKPFSEEQFVKSFRRFLQEVSYFSPPQYVLLDFNKTKNNKIRIEDIVYLCTDKMAGSESNNKQIHFINRKPANLIDFSFSKMEDKGLLKSQFVTIHKSFRVNRRYIKKYHSKTECIEISIFDDIEKTKCQHLKVSENYQPVIRKMFG